MFVQIFCTGLAPTSQDRLEAWLPQPLSDQTNTNKNKGFMADIMSQAISTLPWSLQSKANLLLVPGDTFFSYNTYSSDLHLQWVHCCHCCWHCSRCCNLCSSQMPYGRCRFSKSRECTLLTWLIKLFFKSWDHIFLTWLASPFSESRGSSSLT